MENVYDLVALGKIVELKEKGGGVFGYIIPSSEHLKKMIALAESDENYEIAEALNKTLKRLKEL